MPNQSDSSQPQNPTSTGNPPIDTTPPLPVIPDFQTSDIPPLPAETTPPPVTNIEPPAAGNPIPSAGPSIPPIIPPTPKKKFGGGKIIATILGILVLAGGIIGGVVLIQQQQNIQEKAREIECENSGDCGTGYKCKNYKCVKETGGGGGGGGKEPCNVCVNNVCKRNDVPLSECTTSGQCSPVGAACGTVCQSGQTACTESGKSVCRDLKYDARNCGNCGHACSSGLICWQGVCATPAPNATCPSGYTSGGSNRDAAEEACEGNCGIRESPTANRICENGNILRANTGTVPNWCYKCTGGGETPTAPPGGGPTASCQNIKAYSASWSLLSASQLSQLSVGGQVNFCVSGTTTQGTFDKAKFTINSVAQAETTSKRPGSSDFCQLYTIPAGTTTFNITAQIHHPTLGWK